MRVLRRVVGLGTAIWLIAACAATAPTPARVEDPASAVARAAPTLTPSPGSSPVPRATPTTPPATAATTASPTAVGGPVILASNQYPYELTVPSGPVAFVSARGHWDGEQKLSSDSFTADHARTPGSALMFIAMTETTKDVDGFADDIEARFQAWHGCTSTSGHRRFTAGELDGIVFAQTCAGGAAKWVRAVLVGDGRALVMYTDGGTQDDIVKVLGGIRFVEP